MAPLADLIHISPQEFLDICLAENIKRFSLVYDEESRSMLCSHPQLQPLADFVGSDTRDFLQHEGLFFQITPEHPTLQGAFVHNTRRGQAAGGVRYWHYDTIEDYLRDGLRLSKGMTRKNALAGLWWGGGKGVMARQPGVDFTDLNVRAYLYREYGRFISSLRGCYVTAEDVGTSVQDMASIFSHTRFTTCIPGDFGGSGNPSVPTARGVVSGMEAALEFQEQGGLEGKTVAVPNPLPDAKFDKLNAMAITPKNGDRESRKALADICCLAKKRNPTAAEINIPPAGSSKSRLREKMASRFPSNAK